MNQTIKIFSVIAVVLITALANAQNPGGIAEPMLWLRQEIIFKEKKVDTSGYFNFNPKFFQASASGNYSNLLGSRYSLFLVFRSDEKDDMVIASLKFGKEASTISNTKIQGEKSFEYKRVNSRDGIVLSYFVSTQTKSKKALNKMSFQNIKNKLNTSKGHDLMEVLFYPKILNHLERQKVETYLSIKYGISRLGNVDYIDSDKNKIWNSKENKNYGNRITGIGSDNSSGLSQKQSGNAEKDGLYIGYGKIDSTNFLNRSILSDKQFLMWGDNGGSTSFSGDKSKLLKKMKRVWKMQQVRQHSDTTSTEVRIDKKQMRIESGVAGKTNEKEMTWLAVMPEGSGGIEYTGASYYPPSFEAEEYASFKGIVWDPDRSGSDLFTFIKAPAFFIVTDVENPNCNLSGGGKIKIRANGGAAPFKASIQSENYSKNILAKEDRFELSNIPVGKYEIRVTDSENRSHSIFAEIEPISDSEFSIASQWYLDEDGIIDLEPMVSETSNFEFEWYLGGRLISRNHKITATEAGDYTLIATNSKGCSKEFILNVKSQVEASTEGLKLYPNPIKAYQQFTLQFNLQDRYDADVSIYDATGRLVEATSLYSIKDLEYRNSVRSAGTYHILVKVNGKSHALKLIVQ